MCPEHDLAISGGARKVDAFVHQPPAKTETSCGGVQQQKPQARDARCVRFGHEEHAPQPLTFAFGDPAAFRFDARPIQKVCDDASGDRLDFRAPATFLAVEGGVTLDDPAHVAGLVRTKMSSRPGIHSRQPNSIIVEA